MKRPRRYLFDLSHPAHYLLFKNLAKALKNRGDQVLIAVKQKDVLIDLVKADPDLRDHMAVKSTVEKPKGLVADLQWLVVSDLKVLGLCLSFRPDVLLTTTFSAIHAAFLLRKPGFYFTEDDFAHIHKVIRIVDPFARALLCPISCGPDRFARKTVQYKGYQELNYLHPDVFTPDPSVRDALKPPYLLVRLADLRAHHDHGRQGMTDDFVKTLLKRYGENHRIYLTAERGLPQDLLTHRFPLPPEKMHSALAYADLVIGDSATLMAEAAVLGTPAVYTGYFVGQRGYLNELEHDFGLLWGIPDYDYPAMLEQIDRLLTMPDRIGHFAQKRDEMLQKRFNPTPFYLWFIDNFPNSLATMRQNPDHDLDVMTGAEGDDHR
jgi:uncharacterized protein